jgi:chromatin remodeling complex protein RSC6
MSTARSSTPNKKMSAKTATPVTPTATDDTVPTTSTNVVVDATVDATVEATVEADPQSATDIVNHHFDVIQTKMNDLSNTIKFVQAYVKGVQKEMHKIVKAGASSKKGRKDRSASDPSIKKAPSGFAKPTELSSELCAFLDVPKGTMLARTDVTRRLNAYIKENNLQVEGDKRNIQPDARMKTILNMNEGDKLTFFNMQSYIKHNFLKTVSG